MAIDFHRQTQTLMDSLRVARGQPTRSVVRESLPPPHGVRVLPRDAPIPAHAPLTREAIEQSNATANERVAEAKEESERLGWTWSDGKHWIQALLKWKRAGRPVRTDEEVAEIYNAHCAPCKENTGDRCRKCRCQIAATVGFVVFNKLKLATESCPDGKWGTTKTETIIRGEAEMLVYAFQVSYHLTDPQQPETRVVAAGNVEQAIESIKAAVPDVTILSVNVAGPLSAISREAAAGPVDLPAAMVGGPAAQPQARQQPGRPGQRVALTPDQIVQLQQQGILPATGLQAAVEAAKPG